MQSGGIMMKKEIINIELTKDLYYEISADKTTQIANLKQDENDTILRIDGEIQRLKELRDGLKQIRKNMRVERRTLFRDRLHKFALKRSLSIQNRFAKDLNKAFINGEKKVSLSRFYTVEEQKTR